MFKIIRLIKSWLCVGVWLVLSSNSSAAPAAETPASVSAHVRELLAEARTNELAGDLDHWRETVSRAVQVADSKLPLSHSLRLSAHYQMGCYHLACDHYEEADVELKEALQHPDSLSVATYWSATADLARVKIQFGQYDVARAMLDSVLTYSANWKQDSSLAVFRVRVLGILGSWFSSIGSLDSTAAVVREALQLGSRIGYRDTLMIAALHQRLALSLIHISRLPEAQSELDVAYELLSRKLRPHHFFYANYHLCQGALYEERAEYDSALASYRASIDCIIKTFGEDDVGTAEIGFVLAKVYWTIGRYSECTAEASRALRIARKYYGEFNPLIALLESCLGTKDWAVGNMEDARSHMEKAIAIQEKLSGGAHLGLALSLNNLAAVYRKLEKFAEAESLLFRSLAIREQLLGKDHPDVARVLNNIARLHISRHETKAAQPLLERSLKIYELKQGPDNPDVAVASYNLASCYYSQCQYHNAYKMYRRAHQIWLKTLGPHHPYLAKSLIGLASSCASVGWLDSSRVYYRRLLEVRQDFAKYAFSFSSDGDKLKILTEHPVIDNGLLCLAMQSQNQPLIDLAFEMVLRGKVIALDAVRADRNSLFCSEAQGVKSQLGQYRAVCDSLSTFALAASGGSPKNRHFAHLVAVQDSLEATLAMQCVQFRREIEWRKLTISEVASALPDSTVLWEFVRFHGYDFKGVGTEGERETPPHYAVFVLERGHKPRMIDLGSAIVADSLLVAASRHLRLSAGQVASRFAEEIERQWFDIASKLSARVLSPIESITPPGAGVIIAPDGLLSLLPFEALPITDTTYLVETRLVSYVMSGRDLLSYGERGPAPENAVIVADPSYSIARVIEEPDKNRAITRSELPAAAMTKFACAREWLPLSNTRPEGDSIQALFNRFKGIQSTLLTGPEASETKLKSLGAPPGILHFATHGFFTPAEIDPSSKTKSNPLARCGLVMAGANHFTEDTLIGTDMAGDGLLTALEISAISLEGTQLVCLSCCESGYGEIESGEGVLGLRRAFRIAGAQSVLASIWEVRDDLARDLMTSFYRYWLDGSSRRTALRRAALDALTRARASGLSGHPILWAGFILEGDPW